MWVVDCLCLPDMVVVVFDVSSCFSEYDVLQPQTRARSCRRTNESKVGVGLGQATGNHSLVAARVRAKSQAGFKAPAPSTTGDAVCL